MAVLASLPHFRRNRDGISIYRNIDEWPDDVPLPAGSSIVGVGENHELLLYPQWRFILAADYTLEVITGLFKVSPPVTETAEWYRSELKNLGWVETTERKLAEAERVSLTFKHPSTQAEAKISLRHRAALNDTEIMIQRVRKHPYALSPEQEAEALETPTGEELTRPRKLK